MSQVGGESDLEVLPGVHFPYAAHLQAIKPTVAPFRDNGLKRSSKITEDETGPSVESAANAKSEAVLNEITLDPDYFEDKQKEEEALDKIIEKEGDMKDLPLDEFYKKIIEIKQKIKLEDQYIPSLDNIETAFYELIDTEAEIKRELERLQKEEVKM